MSDDMMYAVTGLHAVRAEQNERTARKHDRLPVGSSQKRCTVTHGTEKKSWPTVTSRQVILIVNEQATGH